MDIQFGPSTHISGLSLSCINGVASFSMSYVGLAPSVIASAPNSTYHPPAEDITEISDSESDIYEKPFSDFDESEEDDPEDDPETYIKKSETKFGVREEEEKPDTEIGTGAGTDDQSSKFEKLKEVEFTSDDPEEIWKQAIEDIRETAKKMTE